MHGSNLIFLVILVVVFYFLLILPQRRQQKKKAEMRKQLNPGSRVMTASGIYGDIAEIHDDIIVVRIADGVEIEMDTRAIVRVVSEAPEQDDEVEETENADGHLLGAPDEHEYESDEEDDELEEEDNSSEKQSGHR